MFPRISNLFMVCIVLVVISGVQQVSADEMEAGTWTQKADMPTGRYLAGSAVVSGKIYVIGGAPVSCGITAVMEEYDPATDTWTRRADMPTARQGVRAAAVEGIVYAIGGWKGDPVTCWGPMLSTVEAYDPAADTWTKKADMPTARTISAIAVVDGIIYVIGGSGENNETLSAVEAYDPAADTWTKKADMATVRYCSAAYVVDGQIYVFGGDTIFVTDIIVPTVEVYDPATDTWTQASDMPWPRKSHTASVVDGKMYIIGGHDLEIVKLFDEGKIEEDKVEELFSTVDVYDPATDTWTTAADLPFSRSNHTAAVVDGIIYAIGGKRGGRTVLSEVYEFDPGLSGARSSVSPGGKLLETWGQIKKVQ